MPAYHCLEFDDLDPGMDIILQYDCPVKKSIIGVRGEFDGWKRTESGYHLRLKRREETWSIPTAIIVGVSELGVNA